MRTLIKDDVEIKVFFDSFEENFIATVSDKSFYSYSYSQVINEVNDYVKHKNSPLTENQKALKQEAEQMVVDAIMSCTSSFDFEYRRIVLKRNNKNIFYLNFNHRELKCSLKDIVYPLTSIYNIDSDKAERLIGDVFYKQFGIYLSVSGTLM